MLNNKYDDIDFAVSYKEEGEHTFIIIADLRGTKTPLLTKILDTSEDGLRSLKYAIRAWKQKNERNERIYS